MPKTREIFHKDSAILPRADFKGQLHTQRSQTPKVCVNAESGEEPNTKECNVGNLSDTKVNGWSFDNHLPYMMKGYPFAMLQANVTLQV